MASLTTTASMASLGSLTSLDAETLLQLSNLASFGNSLGLSTQIALSLAIALSPGDVGHLLAATFIKMQQFIKYISVYYTIRLELVLYATKLNTGFIGFAPDIPVDMLISMTYPQLTGRFAFYLFPRFLLNFWNSIFIIVISTVLWLILSIVERLTKKPQKGYQPYIISRRLRVTFQSFLIAQIYCNFGDILIFSILEIQNAGVYKGIDYLSLSLAIIFILIGLAILIRHIILLLQYKKFNKNSLNAQQRKALSQFKTNHEGLQIFFHSFKDASFTHQLFLVIYIFRLALLGVFVGCLIDGPRILAIMMLGLTVLTLIFTIIRRPFKEIVNLVQYIMFEVVFLVISVALVIIATLDANADLNLSLRDTLCGILLLTGLVFCGISHIFLIAKIIIAAVRYFKNKNKPKTNTNTNINPNTTVAENTSINLSTAQDNLMDLNNSRSPQSRKQPLSNRLKVDRDRNDMTQFANEVYDMASPTDVDRSPRKGSSAIKSKKNLSPGRREKEYQASESSSGQNNNSRIDESQIIEIDESFQTRPRQHSVGVKQNPKRNPGKINRGVTIAETENKSQEGEDGDHKRSRVFNRRLDKKDYKAGRAVNQRKEVPPEVSFRAKVHQERWGGEYEDE